MRVFQVEKNFGIENIRARAHEPQTLTASSVRIAMRAATLNYRDLLMVTGKYNPKQPLPFIPLSDGVGEVLEVGSDVDRLSVGDRVCPLFSPGWIAGPIRENTVAHSLGGPIDGVLREQMVVQEEDAVRIPEHLSDAQAAALPCAALTAWSALFTHNTLSPGDSVLLLGTGGVSIAALQFAKAAGARVYITSSSDRKLERARALGADQTLNYRDEPNWGKAIRKLTGGRGVDHVVEVGGAGTLAQSLRAVRRGGTVSLIGVLAGSGDPQLVSAVMNMVRIQGIFVGHRTSFEAMNRAIAHHRIEPVVDSIFPATDVVGAFNTFQDQKHFGKIAIAIDDAKTSK